MWMAGENLNIVTDDRTQRSERAKLLHVHITSIRIGTIGVHKKAVSSISLAQYLRKYKLAHDMIEPLLAGEAVEMT